MSKEAPMARMAALKDGERPQLLIGLLFSTPALKHALSLMSLRAW